MRFPAIRSLARAGLLGMLCVAAGIARADDAKSGIAVVNAQFCAAVAKADGKAVAALFSSDAVLLPTGSEPLKGTAAIQKFMQGTIDSGVAALTLTTKEVFGHGATATEVGEYAMQDKSGKPIDHGKYMVVWRHADGHWRLHRDIFNSSVPPKG